MERRLLFSHFLLAFKASRIEFEEKCDKSLERIWNYEGKEEKNRWVFETVENKKNLSTFYQRMCEEGEFEEKMRIHGD